MARKKWLYSAIVLFAVLILLVAGCAKPVPEEVAPIKIGAAFSRTGVFARAVAPFIAGIELAVEEINAGGGIRYGGTLHPLVFINYDSKSDVATTTKNVQKLVHEDKVDFLVGVGFTSPQCLAAQEITEPLKIPILHVAFSKELLGPDKRYTFRNVLTTYETTSGLWKWVKQAYPEVKKIALIEKDYVVGQEHAKYLEQAATELGFEIVFKDFFAPGTTDFYPLITKALAVNPDIVDHGFGVPAEIGGVITQLRELGYEGPIIGGTDTEPRVIADMIGIDKLEGYACRGVDWESEFVPAKGKEVHDKAIERYGEVSHATLVMYDTVMIMKQAIEAIDSLDSDKFVDWLENNPVQTIFGDLWYGGESAYGINHQLLYPITIVQIINGKTKQVYFEPFSYE